MTAPFPYIVMLNMQTNQQMFSLHVVENDGKKLQVFPEILKP